MPWWLPQAQRGREGSHGALHLLRLLSSQAQGLRWGVRGCRQGGEAPTPVGACPRPRQHPQKTVEEEVEEEGAPHGALSPQGAPRAWGDPAHPVLPTPAHCNVGRLGSVQRGSHDTLTPGVPSATRCGTARPHSALGSSRGTVGPLRARGEVPERGPPPSSAPGVPLPPGARGGLLWQDGATPTASPGVPGWLPAHLGRARCEPSGGTGVTAPAAGRGQRHGAARQPLRMEVLCLLVAALCAAAPGPGMAPSPPLPPLHAGGVTGTASGVERGCSADVASSPSVRWAAGSPHLAASLLGGS